MEEIQQVSFEHCALKYLDQWIQYDENFRKSLNSDSVGTAAKLNTLKEILLFYKVLRNFPTIYDVNNEILRLKPVLDIIENLKESDLLPDTPARILEIERMISEKYGDRKFLSATTKILWCKVGNPIIIYDSLARIALGKGKTDIKGFYNEWNAQFSTVQERIKNACEKLPENRIYCVDQSFPEEKIREIAKQVWFQKRVFDVYLWSKGKNLTKSSSG